MLYLNRFMILGLVCIAGCSSSKPDDENQATKGDSEMNLTVQLQDGIPNTSLAPRYSPKGKQFSLKPSERKTSEIDPLETQIVLGLPSDKQTPFNVMVSREASGQPYSRLFIDLDQNGQYDEQPIVTKTTDSRGTLWSSFEATFPVKYVLQNETVTQDYAVSMWITAKNSAETPEVIRISRRGFKVGQTTINGQAAFVVLSDSNNDAVFDEEDWWELRTSDEPTSAVDIRNVKDFHWFNDQAYKVEIENATGRSAQLVPYDAGMTRAEDQLMRDPYAADIQAPKAEKPLEFRHDADAAIAEAKEKRLPCFIKFEASWCGPCKLMTSQVFTAKDVVDAASGIVCIKVDGDERRDLVQKYSVNAYPTGILLSAEGNEANRFVGYQSVRLMSQFLTSNK